MLRGEQFVCQCFKAKYEDPEHPHSVFSESSSAIGELMCGIAGLLGAGRPSKPPEADGNINRASRARTTKAYGVIGRRASVSRIDALQLLICLRWATSRWCPPTGGSWSYSTARFTIILRFASMLEKEHSIQWRGHSDTETLVEAIAAWGVFETLRQAVGMFALAVWDRHCPHPSARARSFRRKAALLRLGWRRLCICVGVEGACASTRVSTTASIGERYGC